MFDLNRFYYWKQWFRTLYWGYMCSKPCGSELTCFRPEPNRGPYGLLNFLSAALSTTELWWRLNHRKSLRTLSIDSATHRNMNAWHSFWFYRMITSDSILSKTAIFPGMREGNVAKFQWIRTGFVVPRGQRLGEHQRHTAWWARHSEDTANDHLVQTCCIRQTITTPFSGRLTL